MCCARVVSVSAAGKSARACSWSQCASAPAIYTTWNILHSTDTEEATHTLIAQSQPELHSYSYSGPLLYCVLRRTATATATTADCHVPRATCDELVTSRDRAYLIFTLYYSLAHIVLEIVLVQAFFQASNYSIVQSPAAHPRTHYHYFIKQ